VAFWKFTGSGAEFFPSLNITVQPGYVYDFGATTPPAEPLVKEGNSPLPSSNWASDPGPATDFLLRQASDLQVSKFKRSASLVSLGVPVGALSRVATANQPQQTSVGTFETPMPLACKATNVRLLICNNRVNGTADSTASVAALTLGAAINVGTQAAPVVYTLTVNGRTSFTVDPGGWVLTDPLPIDIDPAVTTPRARIYSSGASWYPNAYSQVAGGGGFTVTTDLTASNTAITEASSATYLLAPAAVFGEPLGQATGNFPTTLIVGDSIANGQYDGLGVTNGINTVDTRLGGGGFLHRGLLNRSGVVNIATPSETAQGFNTFANRRFRAQFLGSCANLFCQYGFNDLFNSARTATQLQGDLVSIWTMGSNRNVRAYQTTITPQNASTDGFMANLTQANSGAEAFRVTVNQWLRDGAPLVAGVAVAAGATGTSVARCNVFDKTGSKTVSASGPSHPLYGVVDTASTVETSTDSGIWKAALNTRTVVDAGMTNGSQTVASATLAFVQGNDRGRVVTVVGAGAAGALYKAVIQNVSSGTTATGGNTAGTTVTNAVAVVGESFVYDGTHPTSFGHAAMAAPVAALPLAI